MPVTKHLVILGVVEAFVMASAVLRIGLGSGIDFGNLPQLIWFIATMALAAAGVAQYVLRGAVLAPRIKAGENVEEDRKQHLTASLAILVAAAILSAAGPQSLVKLLG